ncbi:MAG TPA: hypothetical protein PLV23_05685 [Sedimentibacter sp.]|jgi:cytochrome b561|nr:hypothetical protein [Sedimentibacter sp.]HHY99796.1 hypothetical protein [Tissierellia bacterium]HOW23103.1 hypothetical protein [Sedimentibacter sp.]HRC80165.1 hypothetical protein [Sedimentibacter sp.]
MVTILGLINASLLILLLSPFLLRRINKLIFHNKNKALKKIAAILSKMHMYFAYILLATAFTHGYMALGTIRLHSGYFLWLLVLIQVVVGNMFRKMKKPYMMKVHRALGISSLVLLIFHLLQVN